MNRDLTKPILIAACAFVLTACGTDPYKDPEPNIFPAAYKKEILDTLSTTLTDPTNLRDTYITEPALTMVNKEQRYAVCLRYNERDVNRRYTGSVDRIAFFFAGHLNQLVAATPEQCAKAPYKPFPEAAKLCLGTECR